MQPFHPIAGATASISASTTTASTPISARPSVGPFQLRFYNAGSATVFMKQGDSTVTAATTDMPIPAGAVEVLTILSPAISQTTHIAAITSSGTATLYVTTGAGF